MQAASAATVAGGRERILQAAYERFIDAGYAAVSMQQIADAAGVNKATLYHHFRDKEDLFCEVVRLGFARERASMSAAIERGTTLREKLLALAAHLFGSERADLHRLSADMRQHLARERQEEIWKDVRPPWSYLEAAIVEGVARGELAPVDAGIAARVCFTALMGQVQTARFGAGGGPPDMALAEQVVEILLKGLDMREGDAA